ARGGQELIAWDLLGQRTADNAAILDAPGFFRVAIPAGKRFADKERSFFGLSSSHDGSKQKQAESEHGRSVHGQFLRLRAPKKERDTWEPRPHLLRACAQKGTVPFCAQALTAFGKNGYRHSVLPSQSPFCPNALSQFRIIRPCAWSFIFSLKGDGSVRSWDALAAAHGAGIS